MAHNWFSCKTCTASDPEQDTVKIDPMFLLNKENVQPVELPQDSDAINQLTSDSFAPGQMIDVLRSNGGWSLAAVGECNLDGLTIVLKEGGQKQIPPDLMQSHIRPLSEERRKQAEEELRRYKCYKEAGDAVERMEAQMQVQMEGSRHTREETKDCVQKAQEEKKEAVVVATAAINPADAAPVAAVMEERSDQEFDAHQEADAALVEERACQLEAEERQRHEREAAERAVSLLQLRRGSEVGARRTASRT